MKIARAILLSLLLAPFGRHTRFVFLSYIRHALVIASALLSVAFAVDLTPQPEHLADLAASAPPMRGAEYVSAEILGHLWCDAQSFFRREIKKHRGTVASYLHAKNPVWNLVGRVFFHLAENKGSDETPFAFLATYTPSA